MLSLVTYSDIEHQKRKLPLEMRDGRFSKRMDAYAQVYLRLFATAIEELRESAKPSTQQLVNSLMHDPDVLYDEGAIKRMHHVLGI